MFDIRIAGYLLNSVSNLYTIPDLMNQYLEKTIEIPEEKQVQMNLFDTVDNRKKRLMKKLLYLHIL